MKKIAPKTKLYTTLTLSPAYCMDIASGITERVYSNQPAEEEKDVLLCSTMSDNYRGTIAGSAIALVDIKKGPAFLHKHIWVLDNVRIIEPIPLSLPYWLSKVELRTEQINICPDDGQEEWEQKYFIPHVRGHYRYRGKLRYPYLYD